MIMSTEHSAGYEAILDSVMNPHITFVNGTPPDIERSDAVKQVLHNFVTHQYMDHELEEWEAEDLHQYINERSYHDA